jgi:hypothetical protein
MTCQKHHFVVAVKLTGRTAGWLAEFRPLELYWSVTFLNEADESAKKLLGTNWNVI